MIHLVDTSVIYRIGQPSVSQALMRIGRVNLRVPDVTVLEHIATRPANAIAGAKRRLATLADSVSLPTDAIATAIKLIELLAAQRVQGGRKLGDLLIATIALERGWAVLHYDIDYERIAKVCDLKHEWVVPRGTIS